MGLGRTRVENDQGGGGASRTMSSWSPPPLCLSRPADNITRIPLSNFDVRLRWPRFDPAGSVTKPDRGRACSQPIPPPRPLPMSGGVYLPGKTRLVKQPYSHDSSDPLGSSLVLMTASLANQLTCIVPASTNPRIVLITRKFIGFRGSSTSVVRMAWCSKEISDVPRNDRPIDGQTELGPTER